MRSLYLFFLLVFLTASTYSCIPETSEVLTPEVPESSEEQAVNTNFFIMGKNVRLDYGYLIELPDDEAGRPRFHVVLTKKDVFSGGRLTGNSESVTITLVAESTTDLTGEYVFGDSPETGAFAMDVSYYQYLNFDRMRNYDHGFFRGGNISISRQGEEYTLSVRLTSSVSPGESSGTFRSPLVSVSLNEPVEADESRFQGPNILKYGQDEISLNHAFLVDAGTTFEGIARYRLYLTDQDIAPDTANLTGRSDLIFFYVYGEALEFGGHLVFGASSGNYLSRFSTAIDQGYFCRNMDFTNNTADEDVPVPRGMADLKNENGEMVISFTAESATGETTEGLYRGPLVVID